AQSYQIREYNRGMSRELKLERRLGLEELEKGYRKAKDGRERSHWQMIWLRAQGKSTAEVAAFTGYSVPWVREMVHRFNAEGEAALGDTRHQNLGRRRLLSSDQASLLQTTLKEAEDNGTPWNGVQVAQWMSEALGRPIQAVRGWEVLQRWGFKRKVPRPRHIKADTGEQTAFKKT